MKATIRRTAYRSLRGYIQTYRGPQLDMVFGWHVDTPRGTYGPVVGKRTAENAARLARQGIDITRLDASLLRSLYGLYAHGVESDPGCDTATWRTVRGMVLDSMAAVDTLAQRIHAHLCAVQRNAAAQRA